MKSSLSIDFRSYLKYRDTSLVLIPRWKRKCVAYWFQKPLLSQRRRRIVKASQKLSRERERGREIVCLSIDMKRGAGCQSESVSQSVRFDQWPMGWPHNPVLAEWLKLSSWPMSRSNRLSTLFLCKPAIVHIDTRAAVWVTRFST